MADKRRIRRRDKTKHFDCPVKQHAPNGLRTAEAILKEQGGADECRLQFIYVGKKLHMTEVAANLAGELSG